MRTPEGNFSVQQIQNASTWAHDFRDGKGSIPNAYGPFFIRLRTGPWKGIGIHGTHNPNSIGTNATEGCIRLNNSDLLEFKGMIAVGTEVTIYP
jgi:lipoprotein-anchoring transpeptidase ErfK/SrfK